jgi:hypothetical protein
MKIGLDTLSGYFGSGQKVQGEVIGSGDGKSQVVLNGIPARLDRALPVGQRIEGTVEPGAGGQAVLTLTGAGEAMGSAEGWLTRNRLSPDQVNQDLIKAFQTFRFPITPELLSQARELFERLGLSGEPAEMETLALMMMRKLPASIFPLLKQYVQGGMRLGDLLARLSPEERALMSAEWSMGRLWEKLGEFLQGKETAGFTPGLRAGLSAEVLANIALQESLTNPSLPDQEGHFYFQWPIFWSQSDVPDTLEGEAYFAHSDRDEPGFSMRLLVSPPRLGPLEVGLHRVQQSLWVHFGAEKTSARPALQSMFPGLIEALKALDWNAVKLTLGTKSVRNHFLAPAPISGREEPETRLDVRG